MRKLHWGATVTASLSLAVTAAFVPAVASADTTTAQLTKAGSSASVETHQVTTAEAKKAATYWTAARMKSAIPGDVLTLKAGSAAVQRSLNDIAQALSAKSVDQLNTSGSPTKLAAPERKATSSSAVSENPVSHIGKVFFTLGGSNYVCSGNSVTSSNGSTVSTAGHCLNEGPGAFATNFVFVPAYKNGAAPYGKFTARTLVAPTQWSSQGSMQYDTGFAVMNTLSGKTLAATVGASGVQFNAARGQTYKAFGYPAARPFNGETLYSCTGTSSNDPYNPAFNSQGIPCNMTGGSSGGPWFLGTSSSGYQNSVNSYGYGSKSTVMYGPYWGTVIQSAYQDAAVR
ncbi:trypsin-like serine peptidase [Neomicrococcus aestuarii]|uniref:Peptidase n=1 Tax=Neomicrococcus aestuarii TaxID=556325 RepID=A0A1L2ZPJ8_9MICC|nr:hypothetical protein [Neomicrococcus aestuarii]APF41355.1 hypothetical protein BHE16_10535 [Neomicrococcus aestuarii]